MAIVRPGGQWLLPLLVAVLCALSQTFAWSTQPKLSPNGNAAHDPKILNQNDDSNANQSQHRFRVARQQLNELMQPLSLQTFFHDYFQKAHVVAHATGPVNPDFIVADPNASWAETAEAVLNPLLNRSDDELSLLFKMSAIQLRDANASAVSSHNLTTVDLKHLLVDQGYSIVYRNEHNREEDLYQRNLLANSVTSLVLLQPTLHYYLSGPHAKALPAHTDRSDIFVFQLAGTKHWTICSVPLPDASWTPAEWAQQQEVNAKQSMGCRNPKEAELNGLECEHHVLRAGDWLYMPKATVTSSTAPASAQAVSPDEVILGLQTATLARFASLQSLHLPLDVLNRTFFYQAKEDWLKSIRTLSRSLNQIFPQAFSTFHKKDVQETEDHAPLEVHRHRRDDVCLSDLSCQTCEPDTCHTKDCEEGCDDGCYYDWNEFAIICTTSCDDFCTCVCYEGCYAYPGNYNPTLLTCEPCRRGKVQPNQAHVDHCTPCEVACRFLMTSLIFPAARIVNLERSAAVCTDCPPGTTNPATGKHECYGIPESGWCTFSGQLCNCQASHLNQGSRVIEFDDVDGGRCNRIITDPKVYGITLSMFGKSHYSVSHVACKDFECTNQDVQRHDAAEEYLTPAYSKISTTESVAIEYSYQISNNAFVLQHTVSNANRNAEWPYQGHGGLIWPSSRLRFSSTDVPNLDLSTSGETCNKGENSQWEVMTCTATTDILVQHGHKFRLSFFASNQGRWDYIKPSSIYNRVWSARNAEAETYPVDSVYLPGKTTHMTYTAELDFVSPWHCSVGPTLGQRSGAAPFAQELSIVDDEGCSDWKSADSILHFPAGRRFINNVADLCVWTTSGWRSSGHVISDLELTAFSSSKVGNAMTARRGADDSKALAILGVQADSADNFQLSFSHSVMSQVLTGAAILAVIVELSVMDVGQTNVMIARRAPVYFDPDVPMVQLACTINCVSVPSALMSDSSAEQNQHHFYTSLSVTKIRAYIDRTIFSCPKVASLEMELEIHPAFTDTPSWSGSAYDSDHDALMFETWQGIDRFKGQIVRLRRWDGADETAESEWKDLGQNPDYEFSVELVSGYEYLVAFEAWTPIAVEHDMVPGTAKRANQVGTTDKRLRVDHTAPVGDTPDVVLEVGGVITVLEEFLAANSDVDGALKGLPAVQARGTTPLFFIIDHDLQHVELTFSLLDEESGLRAIDVRTYQLDLHSTAAQLIHERAVGITRFVRNADTSASCDASSAFSWYASTRDRDVTHAAHGSSGCRCTAYDPAGNFDHCYRQHMYLDGNNHYSSDYTPVPAAQLYLIQVESENHAGITTTLEAMLRVDSTPPDVTHAHVQDSASLGQLDIDFMQVGTGNQVTLHASFTGFVDLESEVRNYLIAFTDKCLTLEDYCGKNNIDSAHGNACYLSPVDEAQWLAAAPVRALFKANVHSQTVTVDSNTKRIYANVMAQNNALLYSAIQCSDGVGFDRTPPTASNLAITGAAIRPGIVTSHDGSAQYYISKWGVLQPLPQACGGNFPALSPNFATVMAGSDDFFTGTDGRLDVPRGFATGRNATALPAEALVCSQLTPAVLVYNGSLEHLVASWNAEDADSGIWRSTISVLSEDGSTEASVATRNNYLETSALALEGLDEVTFQIEVANQVDLNTVIDVGPFVMDHTKPVHRANPLTTVTDDNEIVITNFNQLFVDAETKLCRFDIVIEYDGGSAERSIATMDPDACLGEMPATYTISPPRLTNAINVVYTLRITAFNAVGMRNQASVSVELVYAPPTPSLIWDVLEVTDKADIDYIPDTVHLGASWPSVAGASLLQAGMVLIKRPLGTAHKQWLTGSRCLDQARDSNSFGDQLFIFHHTVPVEPSRYYTLSVKATSQVSANDQLQVSVYAARAGALPDALLGAAGVSTTTSAEMEFQTLSTHLLISIRSTSAHILELLAPVQLKACRALGYTGASAHDVWSAPEVTTASIRTLVDEVRWMPVLTSGLGGNDAPDQALVEQAGLTEWQLGDHVAVAESMAGNEVRVAAQACFPKPGGCMQSVLSEPLVLPAEPEDVVTTATCNIATTDERADDYLYSLVWERFDTVDVNSEAINVYETSLVDDQGHLAVAGTWTWPTSQTRRPYLEMNTTHMKTTVPLNAVNFMHLLHEATSLQAAIRLWTPDGLAKETMVTCSVPEDPITPVVAVPWSDVSQNPALQKLPVKRHHTTTDLHHFAAFWPRRWQAFERLGLENIVYGWDLSSVSSDTGTTTMLSQDNTTAQYAMLQGLHLSDGMLLRFCVSIIEATPQSLGWRYCAHDVSVDLSPPHISSLKLSHPHASSEVGHGTEALQLNWHVNASDVADLSILVGYQAGRGDIAAVYDVKPASSAFLFQDLSLQSGRPIYATLQAIDFAGNMASLTSSPIIVDTTPPYFVGTLEGEMDPMRDGIGELGYLLRIDFDLFEDDESLVVKHTLALGSSAGTSDIRGASTATASPWDLRVPLHHHGADIFATLCATNEAGLSACVSELLLTLDATPPTVDTSKLSATASCVEGRHHRVRLDLDWTGAFEEPDSEILEFQVLAGDKPGDASIFHDMVTRKAISFEVAHGLVDGEHLQVTVYATNTDQQLSSPLTSSLLVDCSAPLSGAVEVYNAEGLPYHSSRSSFRASLVGFVDPHSGIAQVQYCLSTAVNSCDVLNWTMAVHHTEIHHRFGSNVLQSGARYFVRVRVTNGMGQTTEGISASFGVDTTAPTVSGFAWQHPISRTPVSAQYLRSVLLADWTSTDEGGAGVHYHEVEVAVHHDEAGGELAVVSELEYDASLSVLNLTLQHGEVYFPRISSCDGAGNCQIQDLVPLAMDVTPPLAIRLHHNGVWNVVAGGTLRYTVKVSAPIDEEGTEITHFYVKVGDQAPITFTTYSPSGFVVDVPQTMEEVSLLSFTSQLQRRCDMKSHLPVEGRKKLGLMLVTLQMARSDGVTIRHEWLRVNQQAALLDGYKLPVPGFGTDDKLFPKPFHDIDGQQSTSELATTFAWSEQGSSGVVTGSVVALSDLDNVATYEVGFGTTPGEQDVLAWTLASASTGALRSSGLSLVHGQRYYSAVRVETKFRHTLEVVSDGVMVDDTPPLVGVVYFGPRGGYLPATNVKENVSIRFEGFVDPESALAEYVVALARVNNGVVDEASADFSSTGLYPNATLSLADAVPGASYVALVKAINSAGLTSAAAVSEPLVLDEEGPQFLSVLRVPLSDSQNSALGSQLTVTGTATQGNAVHEFPVDSPDILGTSLSGTRMTLTPDAPVVLTMALTLGQQTWPTRVAISFDIVCAGGAPRTLLRIFGSVSNAVNGDVHHVASCEGFRQQIERWVEVEAVGQDITVELEVTLLHADTNATLLVGSTRVHEVAELNSDARTLPSVTVQDRTFAVLHGSGADSAGTTCQSAPMTVPTGWRVATGYDPTVRDAARQYNWGTAYLATSSGVAYATAQASDLAPVASNVHVTNGGAHVVAADCASHGMGILLEAGSGAVQVDQPYHRGADELQAHWVIADAASGIRRVLAGAGSQPEVPVYLPLRPADSIDSLNLHMNERAPEHGHQIAVIVEAQDWAGLRVRATNDKVVAIVDESDPEVTAVQIAPTTESGIVAGASYVNVTYHATDPQSGILRCHVSVLAPDNNNQLHGETVVHFEQSSVLVPMTTPLEADDVVHARVACVNGAGLMEKVTSPSIFVASSDMALVTAAEPYVLEPATGTKMSSGIWAVQGYEVLVLHLKGPSERLLAAMDRDKESGVGLETLVERVDGQLANCQAGPLTACPFSDGRTRLPGCPPGSVARDASTCWYQHGRATSFRINIDDTVNSSQLLPGVVYHVTTRVRVENQVQELAIAEVVLDRTPPVIAAVPQLVGAKNPEVSVNLQGVCQEDVLSNELRHFVIFGDGARAGSLDLTDWALVESADLSSSTHVINLKHKSASSEAQRGRQFVSTEWHRLTELAGAKFDMKKKFNELALTYTHIAGGLPPRASVYQGLSYKNGVGRQRAAFFAEKQLSILTRVSKTYWLSLNEQHTFRYMDQEISTLIFMYLLLCKPLEHMLSSWLQKRGGLDTPDDENGIHNAEQDDEDLLDDELDEDHMSHDETMTLRREVRDARNHYNNSHLLFNIAPLQTMVSPATIYAAFRRQMTTYLHRPKLGVATWRHAATFWMTTFVINRLSAETTGALGSLIHTQAQHSGETAQRAYARTASDHVQTKMSSRLMHQVASQKWHALFGLDRKRSID
ncbi:uncharacterized protein MONBRDRAFT_25064 [Monosiga brevicollis MX1]|uniref:JmjC domain-containing protein n=1 Tax=Monosiga brevicollis TaxID=81824 RepID=A9UXN7_MONBE|nr:uncharacterized protein MONBRDRAFT_25064 [Monosiga brevicollis MX1]EDQ89872.1 predicted protein [Monosiga brevicollis MX1]|eukprot:XP_001745294.1 hypothetical protein [Monosiga brevicollis MX1]